MKNKKYVLWMILIIRSEQSRLNIALLCFLLQEIVDWYYAIRAAKFEWRRIAHPQQDEIEVLF